MMQKISKYVDLEKKILSNNERKDHDAEDFIISPQHWNMDNVEAGIELKNLLHHLTIYAPFKGRPFVRAWLETLLPCFSHWIMLSYTKNEMAIMTLKHFFGA